MKDWMEALWLSKKEIRVSGWNMLISLGFSALFTLFILVSINSYLTNGFVGLDFLMIIIFTIGPLWAKPKVFQIQRKGNSFYSSAFVTTLQQLPIKRTIIIKSRILTYLMYGIPSQLLLLVCLYTFSNTIQNTISLLSYVVFALIWFALSMSVGNMFVAGEIGEQARFTNETLNVALSLIISLFTIILLLTILHLFFGNGLIYGTLYVAKTWPVLSTIIAIFIIFISINYWIKTMAKQIRKLDYFN